MRRALYSVCRKLYSAIYVVYCIVWNRFSFFFQGVVLRGTVRIRGVVYITNLGRLVIGDQVRLNSGRRPNPIGGDESLNFWTFPEGVISIGDGVGISSATIVAMKLVRIGEGTNVGGGCKIFDNDFHPLGAEKSVKAKPVLIGCRSFIGGYSIIGKGVEIGDDVIVAAGSVVVKSIPSGEIWGGNPAKFISKNIYI